MTDQYGNTKLHRACSRNDLKAVKELIKTIDPNIQDVFGMTCVFYTQNLAIVKFLFPRMNFQIIDSTERTCFYYLPRNIQKWLINKIDLTNEIVIPSCPKFFIKAGANLNKICTETNLLIELCINCSSDIKFCIKNGIELNIGDKYGDTALFACQRKEELTILINNNSDITIKNIDKRNIEAELRRWNNLPVPYKRKKLILPSFILNEL